MERDKPTIWFPAKKYGWGWGLPCAWQGWVVLILYVCLLVALSLIVNPALQMKSWVAAVVFLSSILVLVCWWKGEKPSWRRDDKE